MRGKRVHDAFVEGDVGIWEYAPLVMHWSTESGLVSAFWVGLSGTWVGAIRVKDASRLHEVFVAGVNSVVLSA